MGLEIFELESKFIIRCCHTEDAIKAIKSLKGRETTGFEGAMHFMWIKDSNAINNSSTLEEALEQWRWSVYDKNEEDDVIEVTFTGENYGDEDLLFEALAPFVESGSFITMADENGVVWRWRFFEQRVKKEYGRIVFDSEARRLLESRNALGDWPHY